MVNIPQETIGKSRQNKQRKVRTIRQQQVFRAAENLYYVMVQMRKNCPVKYRAVLEPAYNLCINMLVSLSLAYGNQDARVPNLTLVAAHLDAMIATIDILRKTGSISRDDYKKAQSLALSCYQQTMAWRASSLAGVPQCNAQS